MAKYLNDNAFTRTIQALADPTRREILRLLGESDLSAGEIASNFSMSLPSVSHHLSVLKSAELVVAERKGQSIVYTLNSTVVQEAAQELMALLKVGETKTRVKRARRIKGG